jgi:hypothetical protein
MVVAELGRVPDGWQRCALAFLEARCWQRAAVPLQQQFRLETESLRRLAKSPRPKSRWWTGALTLAAVFLLAFGIGTFLPNPWNRSPSGPWAQHQPPATSLDNRLASGQNPPPATEIAPPQAAGDLYLGNLTLVNDSGRKIDVPVYDWNQQVAEQLLYQSPPLSSEVFRHLKRHQVRSYQSYVPVRLEDGRRVVVPVQELDITPVVANAY